MTAIAFFMVVLGLYLGVFHGHPMRNRYNAFDRVGMTLFYTGSLMLLGVLVSVLWRFAP